MHRGVMCNLKSGALNQCTERRVGWYILVVGGWGGGGHFIWQEALVLIDLSLIAVDSVSKSGCAGWEGSVTVTCWPQAPGGVQVVDVGCTQSPSQQRERCAAACAFLLLRLQRPGLWRRGRGWTLWWRCRLMFSSHVSSWVTTVSRKERDPTIDTVDSSIVIGNFLKLHNHLHCL